LDDGVEHQVEILHRGDVERGEIYF
jgi:hypothetical protein